MAYYHLEKLAKASFSLSQIHTYFHTHFNISLEATIYFQSIFSLFPFSSGFGAFTGCDTINLTFTKSRKS